MKKIITGCFHTPFGIALSLAIFAIGANLVCAQSDTEHSQNKVDQTLRSNARINPSTLAMELSIPINDFSGRGGATMPLVFSYSSKVWEFDTQFEATRNQVQVSPLYSFNGPRGGWTTSYDAPRLDTISEQYDCNGNAVTVNSVAPDGCYENFYVKKMRIKMPGGTTHELRKDDAVYAWSGTPDLTGIFYSVDGTRVRFEWSAANTGILYLPDGGRYFFQNSGNLPQCYKYIDRHGNVLSYNATARTWTDTLGRTLPAPISDTPTEETKILTFPSIGGTLNREYKFVWKKLSSGALISGDELYYKTKDCGATGTPREPRLFDNNTHLIPCDASADYFDPIVLSEIILPNNLKYQFAYNHFGEIVRIDYPTGAYERFVYAQIEGLGWDYQNDYGSANAYGKTNRGVVDRYVGADDVASEQQWHYFAGYETIAYDEYVVQTTAPDGTKTRRMLHRSKRPDYDIYGNYGFDGILSGMEKDSQTFDTNNQIRLRKLTDWTVTAGADSGYGGIPERDARIVREVSIIFDPDSTSALATLVTNEYDAAGSSDPAYFSALNLIRTTSYHYAVIPASVAKAANLSWTTINSYFTNATPAAISEMDYLYDADYKNRGIVGMVKDTRIIDPAAAPANREKAKSHIDYDEATYLETGTAISGWENPNTSRRGLPTTTKVWNDTNNSWIATHTQYDQFGNVRKTWDGRGNFTEIQYTDNYSDNTNHYSYALPTKTIASSNGNGTGTIFETSVKYDYNTGLPVSTTDANNLETRIEYVDSLLRPTKTQQYFNNVSVGAATETIYGAGTSTSTRYVKTRAQIDEVKWKEGYSWFDGLGRAIKSQSVDSNGDVFALTCYDTYGRPSKVSNPFRNVSNATCSSSLEWTTNTYDAASRIISVTTPDAAHVDTVYSLGTGTTLGTVVTVTDQALKQRRSITNALGQLKRVDEPTGSGLGTIDTPNQPTSYDYNTLNNLTTVTQGAQTRNFVYDSLSRLKSAQNPESGTIAYTYDNNGNLATKIDANTITTTYSYDGLNRVTLRDYSDTTPDVAYIYDNLTNAKGKLTKVTATRTGTNAFSAITDYQAFDQMGRVTQSQQTVDGETYGNPQTYTYNLSGALIEEKYPSGRVVKNVLDTDGDLALVQSKKNSSAGYWNYAKSFTYTAAGAVSSMQLGNGRWESTVFNSRLQPININLGTTQGAADKLNLAFTYNTPYTADNNGNVLTQTITVPTVGSNPAFTATQTYNYDELNRLKDATETIPSQTGWKQTFKYDRYGNRQFDTSVSGNTTTLGSCATAVCNPQASASNNKFSTSDGYTYDNAGNTKIDAMGRQFTYDAENKQTEVKNSSNVSIGQYFYDGDGKRVKKYDPQTGETTIFVYDASGKMVAEYATTVASASTAQVSYLTADHLGSPRINTDANGQVTARHDYQPFGEEVARTGYGGDEVRKQFTSYERDTETNLDFAKARYHNSNLGRFQSPDPVLISKLRIRNPQIWNSYSYAGNNPLRYTDPNGLEKIALGDDEKTIKKEIETKKDARKAIDNDKTLTKAQKEEKKAEINGQLKTLETKLDGTRLVNSILKDLDSIGERNGLQLSDFSLTTDAKNDFAGVPAASMTTILSSQAFHRGGEIYIRTDIKTGFYNAITTQTNPDVRSDFLHIASAIVAHEQYHKANPLDPEKPAYTRERDVFRKFEKNFNYKETYDKNLKEINDAINSFP